MIKTQEDFFSKIFTSHFIATVRKGLLDVFVWERSGDWTELKYFDPKLMAVSVVSFLFSRAAQPEVLGPLCWVMAFFIASYQQLLWSPNFIGVPEGPLGRVWLYLSHLVYFRPISPELELNWHLTSVLTALYNSSTPTWSPTRSLKSNV